MAVFVFTCITPGCRMRGVEWHVSNVGRDPRRTVECRRCRKVARLVRVIRDEMGPTGKDTK